MPTSTFSRHGALGGPTIEVWVMPARVVPRSHSKIALSWSTSARPTESADRTSLKLQRDRVRQYQTKVRSLPHFAETDRAQLQYVLDREYAIAREALRAGDKDRARLALRRRAYQQGLIRKTDEQIATLQELVRWAGNGTALTRRYLRSSSRSWSRALCMAWSRATRCSSRSTRRRASSGSRSSCKTRRKRSSTRGCVAIRQRGPYSHATGGGRAAGIPAQRGRTGGRRRGARSTRRRAAACAGKGNRAAASSDARGA